MLHQENSLGDIECSKNIGEIVEQNNSNKKEIISMNEYFLLCYKLQFSKIIDHLMS